MNLTINKLPTRTWNRLRMNETRISFEGEYKNHAPEATWNDKEVLWVPDAKGSNVEFPGGLRGELDILTSESTVELAETQPGVVMTEPMLLVYDYAENEQAASKLVLHASENSELKVVMLLKSPVKGSKDNTVIQAEVYADENAKVDLYVAQILGNESYGFFNLTGVAEDHAVVNLTKLELGAGHLYADTEIDLKGLESEFNTDLAYNALEYQVLDMNYVAVHHGKRTNCLMEAAGTLREHSEKIFRGTIDFQQGCAGAKGTENESVLLLGDTMINQTIPLILCKEEDVEGNHGASIGKLDDKVLFYLGSRGIPEEAAQQMIAQSRVDAVCQKIPSDYVQAQVREYEDLRGTTNEQKL